MSTNLYWEIHRPARNMTLGDGLKWAIEKHYGRDVLLNNAYDIAFLEGVRATRSDDDTVKDCNTLIDAIRDYGAVHVWIAE